MQCAFPENIHTPPLKILEFPEGVSLRPKHEMYHAYLEFPEGCVGGGGRGGRGLQNSPFCGGGKDIFWKYTMLSWWDLMKFMPSMEKCLATLRGAATGDANYSDTVASMETT